MSLTLVISRVQTLFEAQGQKWCDKDYIIGFLSLHNEDIETWLAALDLSYLEQDIILPAVPAGTSNLAAYQATGHELDDMMSPYSLEWKRPQDQVTSFADVGRVDKVIDVNPNNPIEGIQSYSWKGGLIQISPSSIDCDIRVGCELLPDVFQSDSDSYIKGMTNCLAYGVAEMIAMSRGSGASKLGVYFNKRGMAAMDNVERILVKQEQLTPRRFAGRRSRTSGRGLRLPRE